MENFAFAKNSPSRPSRRRPNPFTDQRGETLVMLVISVAILCLIMDAVVSSIAVQMQAQRDMDLSIETRTVAANVSGVFSAPSICQSNIDQTMPLNLAGAMASSGAALRMTLPGGAVVAEGQVIPGLPLRIRTFRFSDAAFIGLRPGGLAEYMGKLTVGMERTDTSKAYRPREVGLVTILMTMTGSPNELIRGCSTRPSESTAQAVCASMGGVFDAASAQCGCPAQAAATDSGLPISLPSAANGSLQNDAVGAAKVSHLCVSGRWAKIIDETVGGAFVAGP